MANALEAQLGREAAMVLLKHLPPTGWGDVATKRDLELLESRLESRFDARLEDRIAASEARIDARINEMQASLLKWMIGTMIALTGIVATISTLGR